MLTVGDKIRLKKIMGVFTNIGEVCEVVNVSEDMSICFRFKNGIHLGCMSYKEFETYFDKIEQPKYMWTDWEWEAKGDKRDEGYEFKTNGKKVIVRKCGFKATATCHPNDIFDKRKGIKIALARINVKKAQAELGDILKST